jgi:hypothetical protein
VAVGQSQVSVVGGDVGGARGERLAVARHLDLDVDRRVEPAREAGREADRDVLDHQDREREGGRQLAQDLAEHRRAAGRRGDRHDLGPPRGLARLEPGRRCGCLDRPVADDLDLRHRPHRLAQLARDDLEVARRRAARLADDGQRAGAERVHGGGHVADGEAGRHDDDRRRHSRHDDARGVEAAHARHLRVHRDDVGAELLGLLDRLLPVGGVADHLEVRLRLEDG